jgi:hypothetical protein
MGSVDDRSAHTRTLLGGVAFAAVLLALLVGPAAADAAKVRIGGSAVNVSPSGVAPIKVTNPNRSAAKGKLSLVSAFTVIGSKSFRIPARSSRTVKVPLLASAFGALQQAGTLATKATATAKRKGTARKSLTLKAPGAARSPGSGGPPPSTPATDPVPATNDGRYQGTYGENNTNLSFNVHGNRVFTGPFDAFYIEATCTNQDPEYTGPNQVYTDATAMEPVEAAVGPDGRFSGQGVYRPSPDMAKNWTLTGTLSGRRINDGQFSVNYTDYYGNPCTGVTRFTAAWYGDYEL